MAASAPVDSVAEVTRLRTHLSYANIASTICLFVVLGGGAYAASTLSKNSVGAKQIKKNAVGSSEVKNASLLANDFKAGELPAGVDGEPGAPGTARAYGYASATGALDAARSKNLTVTKIAAQTGAYCVRPTAASGIDPTTARPVVSADLSSGVGAVHIAQISSNTFYPAECPQATGWEVYTQIEFGGGTFANGDVGFSVLVP